MGAGELPTLQLPPPLVEKYEACSEGLVLYPWVSSAHAAQSVRPFAALAHETDAKSMNSPPVAAGTAATFQEAPPSLEYSAVLKLRLAMQTTPVRLAQVVPGPIATQSRPPAAQEMAGAAEKTSDGWLAICQEGVVACAAAAELAPTKLATAAPTTSPAHIPANTFGRYSTEARYLRSRVVIRSAPPACCKVILAVPAGTRTGPRTLVRE